MDDVLRFLEMGGYAAYIWPAWGLTIVVLVGLLVTTLRAVRRNEAELEALQATMPQRSRRRNPPAGNETEDGQG